MPWPGYKERRLVIRKWLLSLRCDCITMVQPAESRQGLNPAFTRRADFRRPTCWRVLRESKMSPVLVIVVQVRRHQPFEMALIQDNHVVKQVASANLAIGVANRTDSASWGNSVQSAFSFFFRPLFRNCRYFPHLALQFRDRLSAAGE